MKNLAIYLGNNNVDFSLLKKIREYVYSTDKLYNIFLCSDNNINVYMDDFALLHSNCLDWMSGTVLFLTIDDFMSKSDLSDQSTIIINKKQISELTKEIINKCNILINEPSGIRKVKNAELQQLQ